MENKQELILNRIILFSNIYSEYECHLDSIPSRLLNGIIKEIENNDAILFTLNCLKETSFCNHTKSLLDNPFYLNNLIDTFNSSSYQNLLYKQSSDENVIRKILDTLLFLQSYEFKLKIEKLTHEGLCDDYEFFLRELYYINFPKYEIDYMRRYLRQFDSEQLGFGYCRNNQYFEHINQIAYITSDNSKKYGYEGWFGDLIEFSTR